MLFILGILLLGILGFIVSMTMSYHYKLQILKKIEQIRKDKKK